MRKVVFISLCLIATSFVTLGGPVWFGVGDRSIVVDLTYDLWPLVEGAARYQGPVFSEDDPNWRDSYVYEGVPIPAVLNALGGMAEDGYLHVIAGDGYAKAFPHEVAIGHSVLGTPILAWKVDGDSAPDHPVLPVLIFLTDDGDVSNERMVEALGEDAHMFRDTPSATGLRITGVSWVTTEWDGNHSSLPEHPELFPDPTARLTVTGDGERTYTLSEMMTRYAAVTGPGRYVTSTERMVERVYEGVPLEDILGAWPEEATVEIVAADGYRMLHPYENLSDDEGQWVLAFRSDGDFLPTGVGPLRMVKIGPENPRFEGALSAKMVVGLEVHGPYVPYSLTLSGARDRVFDRSELEAGVACPCHTSTVTVTRRDSTSTFSGIPLWRLLAYVDDGQFPPDERGIYYEDYHFNDELAADGYAVKITAADGYEQIVPVSYLARDDRYIIALKEDGRFLSSQAGGPLFFVWDDSAPAPEPLRRVRQVVNVTVLWDE